MSEWKNTAFGNIPQSWNYEPLENFFELITYGFTNPMPTTTEGPYMVTAKDIYDGKIQYTGARRTSQEAFDQKLTNKSRPRINDVLITKDGSTGRVAIVDREHICISQSVALIRPNNRIVPLFLKFLLESPQYQQLIDIDATGSTIKHIYITKINKMKVGVPNLETQNQIVNLLQALQNKIDLLHKQNHTLEQLAETLFRRWFVEDAQETWDNASIDEVAYVQNGYAFKSSEYILETDNSYEVLKMGHIDPKGGLRPDPKSDFVPRHQHLAKWVLLKDDIILAMTDMKDSMVILGVPALIDRSDRYVLNQRVARIHIKPISPLKHQLLLYYQMRDQNFIGELQTKANGGVQVNLSTEAIKSSKVVVPPGDVQENLLVQLQGFHAKMDNNSKQIRTLTKLRDTLLPKLMSGELRVSINKNELVPA